MAAKNNAAPETNEGMRLDKFLKVSRIIKRRSVASDACDSDHVTVNGRAGKPGLRLKTGDIIAVRFGDRETKYEVLRLSEHAMKADAEDMYRVIS